MVEGKSVMRTWEWALLLLGLVLFGAQAASSSLVKSATFDEEYHITRGYAYLRSGDFRLSFSHPPLVNAWSSLPLLGLPNIDLPTEHPSWAESNLLVFADEFLWRSNENPQEIITLARLPIILLGVALVLVMFWWARQLAGAAAGWVVLLLAVFDPNLLAHSRFVTNDLGLTLFLLLTVWRLWSWLEKPTSGNAVLVGLLAGATMATKFSGLMVWPIILFIMLLYPGYTHRRLLLLAGMGLIALGVLWAVYRFDFGPLPGAAWGLPIPAPFYFSSLWQTFADFEAVPRPAFLFGQVSDYGWWTYFPAALVIKNSIPLLLLSLLGIVPLLRLSGLRRSSVLWLPFLFFLGLGMSGRLSIGFRHILPGIPFLILIAGHAALWGTVYRSERARWIGPVVGVLLLWQVISVARVYPHYEAYFNELAGGPGKGYRLLVDSNLDWGQDLPALERLMEERGLDQVYLSYFGTAPPELYGIDYRPLPSFPRFEDGLEVNGYNPYTPPPGWYAISATSLQLGLYLEDRDLFAFFRDKEPQAQAGYAINLYEVGYPEEMTVKREAVVERAVWEIPRAEFGLQADERLIAKWTQSPNTRITWAGGEPVLPDGMRAVDASFDDAFSLLGFDLPQEEVQAGERLPVTLFWRVGTAEVPMPSPTTAEPLAAFMHISAADDPGEIVAQYDGWEAALTGLEAGDIITQAVEIQIPEKTPPGTYQLRVGLYSPQSWERLPVTQGGEISDNIALAPVTVIAAEEG